MIDMLLGIFLNRGRKTIVFIDTYSHHAFNYALFCSLFCKIIRVKYIPILRGGNLPHRLKKNPYLTKIIFANSIINISPSKFLKIKFLKKFSEIPKASSRPGGRRYSALPSLLCYPGTEKRPRIWRSVLSGGSPKAKGRLPSGLFWAKLAGWIKILARRLI